jgi:ubiquinone/menaquinone biosynthesis C-methylase UbiE
MDAARWLFDERAHAGREHLDPDYARAYDRRAAIKVADEVALLRELGLNERSTLVDFGAGTGTLVLAIAPYCRRVVAVDVSRAMLRVLEAKVDELSVENVEWVQAGFLCYEHQGDRADFVYSRNALHHLPDFWKALALERIAETLKPAGVLRLRDLVFAFGPTEADRFIEEWLAGAPSHPDDGWTRTELEQHLREEHSTFSWLLEPMLEHAGFEIRDVSYDSSRLYGAYVCAKR